MTTSLFTVLLDSDQHGTRVILVLTSSSPVRRNWY